MAYTTINSVLDAFASDLSPSETESEAAKRNKEAILAKLKVDFGTTELVRSGSFGHGTSVRGYSDIDYFAITPSARMKTSSKAALQDFRQSLISRFPATSITVRDPAVSVPFVSQGLNKHEIIPATFINSVNGYRVFLIPDRNDGWMRASPMGHNAWVTQENLRLVGKLKKLVRLVKAWNYLKGAGMRSFYLEMRTVEIMKKESSILYNYDFLAVLRHLRGVGLSSMRDPISITSNIHACSDAHRKNALSRIDAAIKVVERARSEEISGDISSAYSYWDGIFNYRLPVM